MFPTVPRFAPPSQAFIVRAARRGRGRTCRLAVAWLAMLVAARGGTQQNLGFESWPAGASLPAAWAVAGARDAGVELASDEQQAAEGARSLRVVRTTADGVTRIVQRVDANALRRAAADEGAQRVRLSGSIRSDAPGGVSPALWLRIDGPHGPLFLDSYGDSRPLAAATDAVARERDERGDAWQRYELELPLPADVTDVAFGVSVRGQGTAWFDGLELSTAAPSAAPPLPAAQRYVDEALAILREHSLHTAAIDWPRVRQDALAYARGARGPSDAHVAVRFAVRELGDRHSYLQSPNATRTLARVAVANARTGVPAALPRGSTVEKGIGLVAVPGFAGGTPAQQIEFAERLSSVIRDLDAQGTCGWVVDLRANPGGNLWPMLLGLGPLLGDGEVAASVYPDGRRVAVWHRDGKAGFGDYVQLRLVAPYRLERAAPVAVLTGPATASSGEVLAAAFRGRAAARSFGLATRGLSAGNRTFALADGASLVLTVAATTDRTGRIWAGPIDPDQEVAAASRGGPGSPDATLAAALAWLHTSDACR